MKSIVSILLVSIAIGGHPALPLQDGSASLKASAEEVVDLMVAENFAAVTERVNDEFKGSLSAAWLHNVWKALVTLTGPFKERTSTQAGKGPGGYDEVVMTCVFQKQKVTAKVLFDDDRKIVGLAFIPTYGTISPEALEPPQKEKEAHITGLGGVIVNILVSENFEYVASKFNQKMKEKESEETLKKEWASVVQNSGAFIKKVSTQYVKEQDLEVAVVRCEFERGFVQIRVAYDNEKKIGGLKFVREE